MATSGGQPGNNNNKKNRPWADAIRRSIARRGKGLEGGMNILADQLVNAAVEGDQWALKEIGDRVDGRAAQQQIITGADGLSDLTLRVIHE